MANYLLIGGWEVGPMINADEKPVGFDNSPACMCLDMGNLEYHEAVGQWTTLMQEQYPSRYSAYIQYKREQEYVMKGITKEKMIDLLWEAQFENKTENAFNVESDRQMIKKKHSIVETLNDIKNKSIIRVNILIGHKRSKYITNIPGQEITYQQKALEVQKYELDANPMGSNYPYLQAEATATGQTLSEVYTLVKTTADQWNQLGALIEGLRRGTIILIENAIDEQEIEQILINFQTALTQF